MSTINNFLLVFDHSRNLLVDCLEFGSDVELATTRYSELEKQHRNSHAVDIVLVGSDSIETVKVTHSNYFVDGSRLLIERSLDGSLVS